MRYWVKLYTEILHDPKIGRLNDRQFRTCISLFALAGEVDQNGALPPVADMAWQMRLDPATLADDLAALAAVNIVTYAGETWTVRQWAKRQAKPDSAEREQVAKRVHEYRARQRNEDAPNDPVTRNEGVTTLQAECNEGVTTLQAECNEGVTTPEKRREEKKRKEEKRTETEESTRGATTTAGASPPHPPTPLAPAVRVYEDNGGTYASGKLADGTPKRERARRFIAEHVQDDPESLELWGRIVAAYCVQWSSKSYTIMVNDYYLAGRVPGEPTPRRNDRMAAKRDIKRGYDVPSGYEGIIKH